MSKIRICQIVSDLKPTGPGRRVCEISARLDRRRFDVSIIALQGGALAELPELADTPVKIVNASGVFGLMRLSRLSGLIRARRADLVHTHGFRADLAGRPAARLAAVPNLVHTVHDAKGRFKPWQFAYARFLGGYCDRIICVSPSVKEYHGGRSGLPLEKYNVIPSGIDVEAFTPDSGARKRLRKQWGVDDSQPVVGYVGRIDRGKGIETLLSAFSHLAARGNAMDVVIAGEGSGRRIVENFIRHGEGGSRCRLLGYVDDVRSVLSAIDIFTTANNSEGHPLSPTEAMAAGLPVVATKAPGLRDIVIDGITGLLAAPRDVFGLAERIERLGCDPELCKQLGAYGRRRVMAQYPVSAMIDAIETLYSDVAAETLSRRPKRIDADWDQ
ncbi:MAG: glycosyltransferase [Phycisphaerae bacterium]|jgi:glycosyltransferase involved in cell wall biosynthesis|nr:glycosyltransferase [Phycisphaerae bacterium]